MTKVRRLALVIACGAIWLILTAVPALADGGPHVLTQNNGSLGINADGCAGCHRAHTAQGPFLINAADEIALCATCHGTAVTGATTDVMSGIQYALASRSGGTQLGALRGGGFVEARIDSSDAYRYTAALAGEVAHPTVFGFYKKVGVLAAAEPVTSAHLGTADNGLSMPGIAWGNGAFSAAANPGPAVTLACGTCHNPHGNGQYRILNPLPDPVTGAIVAVSPFATATSVTDAALPGPGDARNYTVIQYDTVDGDRLLLASEVAARAAAPATAADYAPATAGDYWHQVVPYNSGVSDSANTNHDAPNGQPLTFNGQINAWCAVCHSRYTQSTQWPQAAGVPVPGTPVTGEVAGNLRTRVCVLDGGGACTYPTNGQPMVTGTGDGVFDFRHTTSRNRACTTCHVAHGSNATMAGAFSSTVTYPNGDPSSSSRLLKVDDRGTCQLCHDPTMTTLVGDESGTTPPALP